MASDIRITVDQERKFRSWAKDPVAFCCAVVSITNAKGAVVPFNMHERPYQIDCMTRFLSTQICAILKARQIGLTTVACGLALWKLLFHENRFVLVLSKNDEDAKKFLRRIKLMYERLPPWVKARGPQIVGRWGKHEAEFDNGSVIYSATSASDHGRGDTPTDVFLDEVGFMRNQDDSWTALVPAVEAGGNLWIFGTAKGFRDWFHLKWLEWQLDPDIDTIFYGWSAVPGRDESWAKRMRRRLGEARFKREYPNTAEEAFQSSGSNVFSGEVLDEIVPDEGLRFQMKRAADGTFTAVPDDEEQLDDFGLFIYEMPVTGAGYLTSADPAEGLVESDPSVIQVLKWGDGEITQVGVFRARIDPEELGDVDHVLAAFYNRATVVVERNNHGITMLKRMARLRTPNIVRGGAGRLGLWTSGGSKKVNIAYTRKALADGHLKLHDAVTVDELYQFQEKRTPAGNVTYAGTQNDDHVDSLCMGVGYAVAHAPYDEPAGDPSPLDEPAPQFSFESLLAQRRSMGSRHM